MARQTSLPASASRSTAHAAVALDRWAGRAASDRVRLTLGLLIAFCPGLLYLCLQPPWQHYDEPTHFEYAWLIAHQPGLPPLGPVDHAVRRDIAASMFQYDFRRNIPQPALLT